MSFRKSKSAIFEIWIFENRNLWFWNLDFPKLTISIFENWSFRVLLLLQKNQNLVEVSLMLSLVRKWGVHTDTHTHRHTHITNFGGRLHKRPFGQLDYTLIALIGAMGTGGPEGWQLMTWSGRQLPTLQKLGCSGFSLVMVDERQNAMNVPCKICRAR